MGERGERGSSGSITAMIVVGAVLLIGLPCLAGAALVGARLFWIARDAPNPGAPPMVQPPIEVSPEAPPVEPAKPTPRGK